MAGAEGNFPENQRVFCNKEVFEKRFGALREPLTGEFAGGWDCRLFAGADLRRFVLQVP